jgi:5-formyltetrahydrofolate cyclo-ligase
MAGSIDDVVAWRKTQRVRLIAERRAMPLDAFKATGHVIMTAAMKVLLANVPRGAVVGCYWPSRREPDCMPFMRELLHAGGTVALPVVVGRGQSLMFRLWTERTRMEAGSWDIHEPAEGEPVQPSALIVPLVGFDREGFRLGNGAGYYDITLAAASPRPFTVGVGFESSRLATIFPQPHDVPLDVIVTEARVRTIREK